jgi:hypothetical protein
LFLVGEATTLYEFPSHSFPYDKQNSKGKILNPDGTKNEKIKGYTRTITDRNKVIQGVVYHPYKKKSEFVRAEEIYLRSR